MTHTELDFMARGVACSAWHFHGDDDRFESAAGRPVVVMAHGFGGTKDSGLQSFAERIAAAGIDVLAFDYRGFGVSEGEPRQSISIKRQVQDYHAAIEAAKKLPKADGSRIAIWGSSMSGGHVLHVAAGRAAIGQTGVLTALSWTASARRLRSPLLVQIADFDRHVPADSVARTAALGNAEVRHYPCDHFDVWPGHDCFEQAAADQVSFLTRTLVPTGVGHGELSS